MQFYIVDVFAEGPYQGNQLAVFRNAGHLSPEAMQAIAREMNFAETTFILSDQPTDLGAYRVRIFTPEYEVPFAGHPTLGTAWVVRERILAAEPPETVRLALKIGTIPVRVDGAGPRLFFTQRDPFFGAGYPHDSVAPLLGLQAGDLNDDLPVRLVSTGLPYVIVPVRGMEALRRIRIEAAACHGWLLERQLHKSNHPKGLTAAFFTFTTETHHPENQYCARMICLEYDRMVEDAATGSANACLAGYLLQQMADETPFAARVEQGYEIGRPSLIHIAGHRRGTSYDIRVGGRVEPVAEGTWRA